MTCFDVNRHWLSTEQCCSIFPDNNARRTADAAAALKWEGGFLKSEKQLKLESEIYRLAADFFRNCMPMEMSQTERERARGCGAETES